MVVVMIGSHLDGLRLCCQFFGWRVAQIRNSCQTGAISLRLDAMLGLQIFGLVMFFWLAIHSAQSLMDLADFLLVLTALWISIRDHDFKSLLTSYRYFLLWPIWLGALALGFIFGAPVEMKVALKSLWEFRWFFSFLCYIYLFKKIPWDTPQIQVLIKYLTVALLGVSILDLVLFFVNYSVDPRAGGLFHHSMPLAHTMGPSALFLLFTGFRMPMSRSATGEVLSLLWKFIFIITPLLAMGLIVLTMTRGVWLGCIVALVFGSFFMGKRFLAKTAVVLFFSVLILFVGSEQIQKRVLGQTYAASQSNNERLLYWKANFEIFRDYPLFGIGYSQNNLHVEEYLKKSGIDWLTGTHAHNQYLHFLAGTGIFGLSCYLFFLFSVFGKALGTLSRLSKNSPQFLLLLGALTGMFCFCLGSLTESNFSIAKNRFIFLFLAAISASIGLSGERARHSEKHLGEGD